MNGIIDNSIVIEYKNKQIVKNQLEKFITIFFASAFTFSVLDVVFFFCLFCFNNFIFLNLSLFCFFISLIFLFGENLLEQKLKNITKELLQYEKN